MIRDIRGLHHVTLLASDARRNNRFFTNVLGQRRIKKTVNFDAPQVYHLYYGNSIGAPGGVITYFPFPDAARGTPGSGEVSQTEYAVPPGSLPFWADRLAEHGVDPVTQGTLFGEPCLRFAGPDGEALALVETPDDRRDPATGGDIAPEFALRGFRGARLRLRDPGATADLLRFMGYREAARDGPLTRFVLDAGNGADRLDLEHVPGAGDAQQGAGSVHHIAFSVPDLAAQARVRAALVAQGFKVTDAIDRDYFWAVYFRSPGGVLFEVATDTPGFDRDERQGHLGEALKLPTQHEHLRGWLETHLPPL